MMQTIHVPPISTVNKHHYRYDSKYDTRVESPIVICSDIHGSSNKNTINTGGSNSNGNSSILKQQVYDSISSFQKEGKEILETIPTTIQKINQHHYEYDSSVYDTRVVSPICGITTTPDGKMDDKILLETCDSYASLTKEGKETLKEVERMLFFTDVNSMKKGTTTENTMDDIIQPKASSSSRKSKREAALKALGKVQALKNKMINKRQKKKQQLQQNGATNKLQSKEDKKEKPSTQSPSPIPTPSQKPEQQQNLSSLTTQSLDIIPPPTSLSTTSMSTRTSKSKGNFSAKQNYLDALQSLSTTSSNNNINGANATITTNTEINHQEQSGITTFSTTIYSNDGVSSSSSSSNNNSNSNVNNNSTSFSTTAHADTNNTTTQTTASKNETTEVPVVETVQTDMTEKASVISEPPSLSTTKANNNNNNNNKRGKNHFVALMATTKQNNGIENHHNNYKSSSASSSTKTKPKKIFSNKMGIISQWKNTIQQIQEKIQKTTNNIMKETERTIFFTDLDENKLEQERKQFFATINNDKRNNNNNNTEQASSKITITTDSSARKKEIATKKGTKSVSMIATPTTIDHYWKASQAVTQDMMKEVQRKVCFTDLDKQKLHQNTTNDNNGILTTQDVQYDIQLLQQELNKLALETMEQGQTVLSNVKETSEKVCNECERKLFFTDLDQEKLQQQQLERNDSPAAVLTRQEVQEDMQQIQQEFMNNISQTATQGQTICKNMYKNLERTLFFTDIDNANPNNNNNNNNNKYMFRINEYIIQHCLKSRLVCGEIKETTEPALDHSCSTDTDFYVL